MNWLLKLGLLLSVLISFVFDLGCASRPSLLLSPQALSKSSEAQNAYILTILGTNDIHGTLKAAPFTTREDLTPYSAGGLLLFASHLKKLRSVYRESLLWIDAGDNLTGSFDSHVHGGQAMISALNELGLTASALGDHDLEVDHAGAQFPYLSANLSPQVNVRSSLLLERSIISPTHGARPIKIGIIGVTTLETPQMVLSKAAIGLQFLNLKDAVMKESQSLRNSGAKVIILAAHSGTKCALGRVAPGLRSRKLWDPQGECDPESELVQLLKSIPTGTIDAVISGHSHTLVHHWIAGIPVIQSGARLRYYGLIKLKFDPKTLELLRDQSEIESPFPVCASMFENQQDCNGDRPSPNGGRGKFIAQPEELSLNDQLRHFFEKTNAISTQKAFTLTSPLKHNPLLESPFARAIAEAMHLKTQADFAIVNNGLIRDSLTAGNISESQWFQAMPYENEAVTLTLTGKDLKLFLRIAENGSRGFFAVSGLKLKLIHPNYDAPSDDIDQNGRIDPWEVNRLLDIKTENDESLSESQTYRIAMIDYLASGGDDLNWVISQLTSLKKEHTGLNVRDLARNYLTESQGKPLPQRLFFDTTKTKKRKSRRVLRTKRRSPRR